MSAGRRLMGSGNESRRESNETIVRGVAIRPTLSDVTSRPGLLGNRRENGWKLISFPGESVQLNDSKLCNVEVNCAFVFRTHLHAVLNILTHKIGLDVFARCAGILLGCISQQHRISLMLSCIRNERALCDKNYGLASENGTWPLKWCSVIDHENILCK